MNFTKIVHLIGGEKILITEKECEALLNLIKIKPQGFVEIQGSLVNKNSISYIGSHHATPDMEKNNRANAERILKLEGKDELVELRKEKEKRIAIENTINENKMLVGNEYKEYIKALPIKENKELPQSSEETMNGEPDYYINPETGEKMYS